MTVSVRKWAGVMAALAMLAVVMVGCGDDGESGGGSIVNAPGEAWVYCFDMMGTQVCTGYIFEADNDVIITYKSVGTDYKWEFVYGNTWATSGNELTVRDEDGDVMMEATYSVSGNSLTLAADGMKSVFTRTSGVTPGEGGVRGW